MSQSVALRTTFDPAKYVRPAIHHLPLYTRDGAPTEKPAREIRLDWNESPYGPSPNAVAAIANVAAHNRYPEFDAWKLREAIGHYAGVPAERIVAGAGLDNVLETLMYLLIETGDRAIISEPTFMVYELLVRGHGGTAVNVPLRQDFSLDVPGILAAVDEQTKLVLICNPNNPTGNLFDRAAIERVVAETPCLVAIDEAYAEFAGESCLDLMAEYPNLAILRTMSKFAGLAGMRVGYGIFPESLMPYLLRVMPGFCNVSAAATAAAIASLQDADYNRAIVARIIADRENLADQLRELPGVEPLPSATNFLLVRLPVADAGPVVRELANRGVFVRHFGNPAFGLLDCLRVSIGTIEDNEIFVAELASVLGAREPAA
ncbi:MAG: histidinol-phosphate transaminase [Chloroflexota bacterium]|nr:histidinol-phosphate transaminase [Chloroflexia bacterium]MDQ3226885.1 histidinol-phosphate transaminase [Chloroflexota bacterium]